MIITILLWSCLALTSEYIQAKVVTVNTSGDIVTIVPAV